MKELEKLVHEAFKFYIGVKLFDIGVIILGWLMVLWLFARLLREIQFTFGL